MSDEEDVIELGEEDSGEEESNDSGDDSEAGPTMKDLYEGNVVCVQILIRYVLRVCICINIILWNASG